MPEPKACHNCRRRRLRCDRSVPECHKCSIAGLKCLGYGKLYRWTDTLVPNYPASGRRKSTTPPASEPPSGNRLQVSAISPNYCDIVSTTGDEFSNTPIISLSDPVLQDLGLSSRQYLYYFATRFCQDLVVHDSLRHGANPFRELIPMSQIHPFLQHIIIAVSAVHYSQAMSHAPTRSPHYAQVAAKALVDALWARQKSIQALLGVLERCRDTGWNRTNRSEKDALLATVLFFLNFDLIDSGGDGWREHLKAAGKLLSTHFLQPPSTTPASQGNPVSEATEKDKSVISATPSAVEPFEPSLCSRALGACDYVASDTVAYYIWSHALDSIACSTQDSGPGFGLFEWDTTNILNILLRTEANSYHSCPSHMMHMLLRASHIAHAVKSQEHGIPSWEHMDQFIALMKEVQSFDIDEWAADICVRNAAVYGAVDDLELSLRKHVAATYRSAICLYILLVAPGLQAEIRRREQRSSDDSALLLPTLPDADDLATTILHHLSFIPSSSPLFKYTTWVVFVTGVEAESPARRAWVLARLQAMRVFCPWGMLTAAIDTLGDIWRLRDRRSPKNLGVEVEVGGERDDDQEMQRRNGKHHDDWLVTLNGMKIDCLIV
ncbi:fungal-specific transcription factor domain-containing protein [Biscogniauxia mediterranea]|nr:fungal-specific transcription factor domain-containing protein [Biscogniauxia mediterranea]